MTGLIISGMHRSGTSLIARLFAHNGWHPGDELLVSETEEYIEDAPFVRLHRQWLHSAAAGIEIHSSLDTHTDWGIVNGQVPDLRAPSKWKARKRRRVVRRYVDRRSGNNGQWIAKDPRCALFLEEWSRVPDLHFLLVYRTPWEVVDSAIRLGHPPFCQHPSIIRSAWFAYNQRILEFARRVPDRVTLISINALRDDPDTVLTGLEQRFHVSQTTFGDIVDPERLKARSDDREIDALYRVVHPEIMEILDALDTIAGVRSNGRTSARQALPGGTLPEGSGLQVIIPCRNDGAFILDAISSVDALSDGTVELTIVDDGSNDAETLRIMEALRQDARQILTTDGLGLSEARNIGARTSRTYAVLPLDADNRLRPATADAMKILVDSGVDIVHGSWQRFGLDNILIVPPDMTIEHMFPVNTVDACAIIKRKHLYVCGGWDPSLPFLEDWDLWLTSLSYQAASICVPEILFEYLVRPHSLLTKTQTHPDAYRSVLEYLWRKHASIAPSDPLAPLQPYNSSNIC